jgi:hypothetical protein
MHVGRLTALPFTEELMKALPFAVFVAFAAMTAQAGTITDPLTSNTLNPTL